MLVKGEYPMLYWLSISSSSKRHSLFTEPSSYDDMLGSVTGNGGRYSGWPGKSGKGAGRVWKGAC